MPVLQPPSPLDRIPNLEPVDPEKVRALEDRLRVTYLAKLEESRREQAELLPEFRRRILD